MVHPMQIPLLEFVQSIQSAFPLMRQLDVPRCLADLASMEPEDKRQWVLKARPPLRMCVGLFAQRQERESMYPQVFGSEATAHTVLCLVADLLARLPQALPKSLRSSTDPVAVTDHLSAMLLIHAAMYQAEARQDKHLGVTFE